MTHSRRSFLSTTAFAAAALANERTTTGARPNKRQLAWSEMGYYNFLHFTVNTFTDKEWGYGDEDPKIFNPTAFDADAIVETLKDSGSRGVILTCKHHDGFCLWPTKTTEHSIKNSPFRNGKGDVVKEVSEAAARHGLKFGVYVSPWDRSQPSYGHPEYLKIYRGQLHELLTNYGPIFEIWHDGANGGDGFYGGAREKRIIDKLHYYDWQNTWATERSLQPGAAIFSDVGPDVRWVGNEKGVAGETCWATYTPLSPHGGPGSPGDVDEKAATTGTVDGKFWMPAECDVSIRPGWFWHEKENNKVKTPRELLELYYVSAGRGASFLLNVPPDRRGLLADPDVASLRSFGRTLRNTFGKDLAQGSKHMQVGSGGALTSTLSLPAPAQFDLVRLREEIREGQRVRVFSVEYWDDGKWNPFGSGTSIGINRILRSPKPVRSDKVRLTVKESAGPAMIKDFQLFAEAPVA